MCDIILTENLGSLPNMKQQTISVWNRLHFKALKIGKRFIFSWTAGTNNIDGKKKYFFIFRRKLLLSSL